MLNISKLLFSGSFLSAKGVFSSSSESERKVYLQQTFKLVRSFIYYSRGTDILMLEEDLRRGLENKGIAVSTYGKNLVGEYGPYDPMMTIISVDDQSTIRLTKENLKDHPLTRIELLKEDEYYQRLITKYPNKEILVKGMLHPLSRERIENANDGEILYYDKDLVNPQEVNLIPQLQTWIYNYLHRFVNYSYKHTDPLYLVETMAKLDAFAVSTILNLRVEACLTVEAHNFHIVQYLKSFGIDSTDIPYLNINQKLFLYKNLRYMKKNAGTDIVLGMLNDFLVKPVGMTLSGYQTTILKDKARGLVPIVEKVTYGNGYHADTIGIDEFKALTDRLAVNNTMDTTVQLRDKILSSPMTNEKTKILEIDGYRPAINTDTVDFSINQWAYMSSNGHMVGDIRIPDLPGAPGYSIGLTESFVYALLLSMAIHGRVSTIVPCSVSLDIVQSTDTIDNREGVDPILFSQLKDMVKPIYQEELTPTTTNMIKQAAVGYQAALSYSYGQEDAIAAVKLETILYRMYHGKQDVRLPGGGYSIKEWLQAKGLAIPNSKESQILSLQNLIEQCTGETLSSDHTGISAISSIIMDLCSYSISIIANTNRVKLMDGRQMRVLGLAYSKKDEVVVPPPVVKKPKGYRVVLTSSASFKDVPPDPPGIDPTVRAWTEAVGEHTGWRCRVNLTHQNDVPDQVMDVLGYNRPGDAFSTIAVDGTIGPTAGIISPGWKWPVPAVSTWLMNYSLDEAILGRIHPTKVALDWASLYMGVAPDEIPLVPMGGLTHFHIEFSDDADRNGGGTWTIAHSYEPDGT